jgi:dTDP-4-dehydrorhamnose reductase
MLARAIQQQLTKLGIEYIGTDRELDIRDSAAVRDFMRDGSFTHVINCAAFTQVDDAEMQSDLAYEINATGPRHLAEHAASTRASLLHFSTDYVFDGSADSPYKEEAPTGPKGAYGRSKLAGEQHVLASADATQPTTRGVHVVRTSWLFGEGGGNFVATMLKLMASREELRVVTDQVGRPTYTADLAAAALLLAGILPSGTQHANGVYHFANSGVTNWWGFANEILRQAGEFGFPLKTRSILPVSTQEFPRPAPRPAYSVLDTGRFEAIAECAPRPWSTALAEYLANLKSSI